MKVNFVPAPNKLLVKVEEALDQTKDGIYIPEVAKEKPMEGKIVAIGPSEDYELKKTKTATKVEPLWKVKDHILFGKYDGVEVRIDNENYLILTHDQILGKRV